jgi:hypothetical protein
MEINAELKKDEGLDIVELFNEYLNEDQARELTARLEQEIGQHTDNSSLKKSLLLLKALYATHPPKVDYVRFAALFSIIAFHLCVVAINIVSFFILPFLYPLYVWMPINSFILVVSFTRELCPLTRLENHIRTSLGKPRIGGFIGYYILRPVKRMIAKRSRK